MNAIVLLLVAAALLNVYALALVLLRVPFFGTILYRPMLLNLALSVAPAVVLAAVIGGLFAVVAFAPSPVALWAVVVLGGLVWLLLLPNSAYLVTELNFSHRREDDPTPLWYDIVLVLTLAMSGVVNTLVNVLLAQVVFVLVARPNDPRPLTDPGSWLLVAAVLVLVSFGIYLGRYVRFNSWDLRHPVAFVGKLREHFREPGRIRNALGFCLVHTLFFAILYLLILAPAVDALST